MSTIKKRVAVSRKPATKKNKVIKKPIKEPLVRFNKQTPTTLKLFCKYVFGDSFEALKSGQTKEDFYVLLNKDFDNTEKQKFSEFFEIEIKQMS